MSSNALKEAGRVMTICNSCRYCEGFCAVFPAMELRRTFTSGDLKYLANLCHNCRDCYYACQYAPPHDFSLNFPQAMAELRVETYSEFASPKFLSGLFQRNGIVVLLTTLLSIVTVYCTASLTKGSDAIFGTFTGPNSFYAVIPYAAMLVPFSILAVLVAVAFWRGIGNFWRETAEGPETLLSRHGNIGAVWDVLTLKYLEGGGHGCNYPTDEFSTIRRTMHHAIFYGFIACLASTTIAAIYDHVFHIPAPYPLLSWPVILGTIGGVLMVIGTAGMLYLKAKMDPEPGTSKSQGMDVSFGLLLFFTSLSGLLLLAFRETSLMGTLLIFHLGLVLALFITMPFGKFVHGIYRYIALVRHSQEQARSAEDH